MPGKPSAVGVHGAKHLAPLLHGGVGGNEHNFRPKFKHFASETGFASLVGVTAGFRTTIFVRWNQQVAIRPGSHGTREVSAAVGEQFALVSKDFDLGKGLGGIGGRNIAFGDTPKTRRKPPPVCRDVVGRLTASCAGVSTTV